MAKELTCEITKDYGSFAENEYGSIKVCEIKWGGRTPKGYDIRKYDVENDRMSKGITIPYEDATELVDIFVSKGLCDIEKIKESIKKREDSIIDVDDFDKMFNRLNDAESKYTRDVYGNLRSKSGAVVILKHKEI